ncbi:MAG: glutamyl-tRNA reductase [Deltaproteobacteria bacterium]|jgi:glutamyl-tRNA reductase|nr:glutamyl-tRNA reductase [Deltaproteobacteria bacterium]MBW2480819.1 glutamyl-tRNA reductase [Deltaproteobacteria bacterium]
MNEIVLIGINHKTAPVEVRECIAFTEEESVSALRALSGNPFIREVLIFSTCNRVEVLVVAANKAEAIDATKDYIAEANKIPRAEFEDSLYIHEGDEAVRHIFRVASSLDSMVVGEPQILGQVKDAYRTATEVKASGVILNRLLHRTFFVAKRIRTETGIGDHAVSISYAAVELGRKIFGSLENKNVLLVGAGEMAELAVEHLIRNKAGQIYVANRTFENGVELARQFNGQPIRFEEITDSLERVDILISSTGSPDYVITRDQVKGVIRKRRNRPLFFIDIAVPRDIDPQVNRLTNSYVYDIDDLQGVIDDNIEDRRREAVKGERIVDEAVIHFREWYAGLEVVPTIVALRNKLESIAETEIKKTLQSNKVPEVSSGAIEKMAAALINKIMHDPTMFLKKDTMPGDKSKHIDTVRKLFKLDE